MTWREVAVHYPEFVQWIVQVFGPQPEEVTEADYTRFKALYEFETRKEASPTEYWVARSGSKRTQTGRSH